MRFSGLAKKGLSVALAVTMLAGVTAAPAEKAAAASAKIPVSAIYCFGTDSKGEGHWIENTKVTFSAKSAGKIVKKTSSVAAMKKFTFKKGKKVHVSLTIKNKTKYTSKTTQAFMIDTYGILSKFKKVKYSNVKVKCDGKSVKAKYQQGYFETKQGTKSQRLVFYNEWGDDTTQEKKYTTKYPIKKKIVVSFDITAK